MDSVSRSLAQTQAHDASRTLLQAARLRKNERKEMSELTHLGSRQSSVTRVVGAKHDVPHQEESSVRHARRRLQNQLQLFSRHSRNLNRRERISEAHLDHVEVVVAHGGSDRFLLQVWVLVAVRSAATLRERHLVVGLGVGSVRDEEARHVDAVEVCREVQRARADVAQLRNKNSKTSTITRDLQ